MFSVGASIGVQQVSREQKKTKTREQSTTTLVQQTLNKLNFIIHLHFKQTDF